MEDVSAALREYSRDQPLPPAEAVARLKQVLDRLARLHARWEGPRQQAKLRRCGCLVPVERFIGCQAASYATALGRTPPAGLAPGSPVTDEFRADVQAFVDWLPRTDRSALRELLYRREPLVAALAAFPRTLLHGDADDRNIGLRQPAGHATPNGSAGLSPELVLIDWEWIAAGPPALDVARLCGSAAAVCDPSQPRPEALFSDELPDYYFERYRAHGGALADRDTWRRSFTLGLLAGALTQVPFAGSMIRRAVKPVVATFERQVQMVLPEARALVTA
jgi:thiamine kinase-like enzyme